MFDFVVIGGGIAGTSICYELAESSRVLLLEREDAPGYHTTGRSAAIYSELMLDPVLLSLAKESKQFFQDPPGFCGQESLIKKCGTIFVGADRDKVTIDSAWKEMCGLDVECYVIDADEIASKVPIVRKDAEAVFWGLYEPHASRIDVDYLMQSYIKGLRSRGAEFLVNTQLLDLARTTDHWVVSTNQGTFGASTIVNAAGAWADNVAVLAGASPIGLDPKRRTMITFDAPVGEVITDWPALGDINGSYYYMPDAGQLMGSLADETSSLPCDAQPEEIDIATAAYNIEQHTVLDIRKINHSWAGLRTFTPDRIPVVGYDPAQEGFFWFAGQGGSGIEIAPSLARLGARLGLDDQPEKMATDIGVDLSMLAPDRFR